MTVRKLMDHFEKHMISEIELAERIKDQLVQQDMRNIYVGQIAGFKAALECYRIFRTEHDGQSNGGSDE